MSEQKINSAMGAFSASLLYLYEAYKESGMTDEEAMKEATYQAISKIKGNKMPTAHAIIDMSGENAEAFERLVKLVEMLVESKQSHVSQIGVEIAKLLNKLFD